MRNNGRTGSFSALLLVMALFFVITGCNQTDRQDVLNGSFLPGPQIESVLVRSSSVVDVVFNSAMNTDKPSTGSIAIRTEDGSSLAVADAFFASGQNRILTVSTASQAPGATYIVTIKDLASKQGRRIKAGTSSQFVGFGGIDLSISPDSPSIAINQTVTFSADGGTSPYSYFMIAGTGSIDSSTGIYTAPSTTGTEAVGVKDANGYSASTGISVTSGPERVVTVGENGQVSWSGDNGQNWTTTDVGETTYLRDIEYAADISRFVTVGSNGKVYYSNDFGKTWSSATSGVSNSVLAIQYGSNRFVATVAGDQSIWSTDGINWNVSGNGPGASANYDGMIFEFNKFIAFADNSGDSYFTYSTDGQTWIQKTLSASFRVAGMANKGTRIWATGVRPSDGVGIRCESTNGTSFSCSLVGGTKVNGFMASNGSRVLSIHTFGDTVHYNDSGGWNSASINIGSVKEVEYGLDKFWVAGDSGNVRYSSDGISGWVDVSPGGNNLRAIAFKE